MVNMKNIKNFSEFVNENKINERDGRYDGGDFYPIEEDNYFYKMIQKYSKKQQMVWTPSNSNQLKLFKKMIKEIYETQNITMTYSDRWYHQGDNVDFYNIDQPLYKLHLTIDFGPRNKIQCAITDWWDGLAKGSESLEQYLKTVTPAKFDRIQWKRGIPT